MKKVYISENADERLISLIRGWGYELEIIRAWEKISTGVSAHPDIYLCKLGYGDDAEVFLGDRSCLSETYPGDILYNAACSGRYFIHNLKHTDGKLLEAAEAKGMKLVNVKQGYAKCSTAVIDEEHFITADRGIAHALRAAGADVLLIEPGCIVLKGYACGFIGGCCGRLGDRIVFNGCIEKHPDYQRISSYIKGLGLELVQAGDYPLEDIGSIL